MFAAFVLSVCLGAGVSADGFEVQDQTLQLFLDVDATEGKELADSLVLGLRAGLANGAELFGGPDIFVALRDHNNNLRRTAATIAEAAENPATLAMIGGMHSPNYLKHGSTVNEQGLVLMLPWSAGATLTRFVVGADNHIFRVSVDDRKAGPFLAGQAVAHGCMKLGILALDNGWGHGNARSIEAQAAKLGAKVVHTAFIRREAEMPTTSAVLSAMAPARPDCIIAVLGAQGTALAANYLATWGTPPTIFSHWGMLGGSFVEEADPAVWDRLRIGVLGTCVLERYAERPSHFAKALEAAARIRPDITEFSDIVSPIAFVNAYDIGLLLRAAIQQAQRDPRWNEGRVLRSRALRDALEDLETPVEGLLKDYARPFASVDGATSDGHEALGHSDLCLVTLGQDGVLRRFERVAIP